MSTPMATPPTLLLPADHPVYRVQRGAMISGALGLIGCIALGFTNPTQFMRAYLLAYVFWTGGALGCLALLMIHHVTGGAWGVAIRRLLESGARTLPWMALLFIPIAIAPGHIYEWAQPEHVAHDPLLQHKALYLNVPFFIGRAVFYFVCWTLIMRALVRWSLLQDTTNDPKPTERLELISRGGLLLMGLTMTFASFDWMMSLEPHWFSTIYGVMFMGGCALTAFAVVIPMAALIGTQPPVRGLIERDQFQDLGKLLLAFVMLWAYFNLSQFLIIWAANLPEEITWYLARTRGVGKWIAIAIVLFHFALPFVLLLSRDLKRSARGLAAVALLVLLVRFLDVFWLVVPAFDPKSIALHVVDVAAVLAVGGFWLWLFVHQLEGRPLLPLRDPSQPVVS
jgi:hypothetical protein